MNASQANKCSDKRSIMISVVFLGLMYAFHAEGIPSRACVFLPWAALLCICLCGSLFRRMDAVCTDLVRLGMHVTALAVLYPSSAHTAYACSLHALMVCAWSLSRDEISACVMCLFGIVAVTGLSHECPIATSADIQLNAMAWPGIIELGFKAVQRLT